MTVQIDTLGGVSATDARARLAELLDRVESGADIVILRHGRPVAVLTSPESHRTRRASQAMAMADRIAADLDATSRRPFGEVPGMDEGWVEVKLDELATHRADRSGR